MANSRRTTGGPRPAAVCVCDDAVHRVPPLPHLGTRHYLVEGVPRPSPVDPTIVLYPRPCALGENCTALQIALPMTLAVVPHAKPSFPLKLAR